MNVESVASRKLSPDPRGLFVIQVCISYVRTQGLRCIFFGNLVKIAILNYACVNAVFLYSKQHANSNDMFSCLFRYF